jgi:hypothetical protein
MPGDNSHHPKPLPYIENESQDVQSNNIGVDQRLTEADN